MSNLTFPLYHATNTIFENSIIKFGLGGKNLIKELKVIELLNELIKIAESKIPNDYVWKNLRAESERMAKQSSTMFEHGQIYVTPSLQKAKIYIKNRYGSEIITMTFKVVSLLRKEKITISDSIINNFENFFQLENKSIGPIIYKINNLHIESIISLEDGDNNVDSIKKQIKKIEDIISLYGVEKYDSNVQCHNFRIGKIMIGENVDTLVY